ncbi:4410_t:CDS:2, partial [Gigaspora rosea]
FLSDFSFNDLVALTPKIACLYKAYSSGTHKPDEKKTTSIDSSIVENLDSLWNWPSDNNIKRIGHHAYKQATSLARNILGIVLNTQVHDLVIISDDDEVENRK